MDSLRMNESALSLEIGSLQGTLANAWVAEAGGVRYASPAEALRAVGSAGLLLLQRVWEYGRF